MKKIRHYKTVRNALNRLFYKRIYIHKYRDTASGHVWLYGWGEGYLWHEMDKKCTAEYDPFRDLWTLKF